MLDKEAIQEREERMVPWEVLELLVQEVSRENQAMMDFLVKWAHQVPKVNPVQLVQPVQEENKVFLVILDQQANKESQV